MYVLLFLIFIIVLYNTFSMEGYTHKSLLSIEEAKDKIKDGEIDLIIDVRTKFEWNLGRHPKAIHVPFGSIQNYDFEEYKDKTVLLYCRTGTRAKMAMHEMEDKVKRVYYIDTTYDKLLN